MPSPLHRNFSHQLVRVPRNRRFNAAMKALLAPIVAGIFVSLTPISPAWAIPPFARQTGAECSACHTVYPELTAFGRQFKANGYTEGDTALYNRVGAWLQGSFTRTAKDQPGGAAPDYNENNNVAMDQASLFYGGKIYGKIGAFLQGTYDGIEDIWGWDNMDVRFADNGTVGGHQLTFGVSVNNNPGVQDLWNSTPVWGFPFDSSGLAPEPAAGTLIEGGLGEISAGATVYGLLDNAFYAEAGVYHTLSRNWINKLTGSYEDTPKSDGVAPYWRFNWQKDIGSHNIAVGTFGLYASLYPDADSSQGSDSYTDIGVDAQYQYTGDRDTATARLSLVHESQDLSASQALGGADNSSNTLWSFNSSVSYTYDKTLGLTAGLRDVWGDRDASLYGTPDGSPNTTSVIIQGDYLPLNKNLLSVYPWFNPKLTVQYVHYFKFDGSTDNVDGTGRKASDNDTLFVLITLTL